MAVFSVSVRNARRIYVAATTLLLLVILFGTALLSFDILGIGSRRSELYAPGRQALVEAQWLLEQTIPHAETKPLERNLTHQHMKTVLDWLETAEDVQPEHRQRVATLRDMVSDLQAADSAAEASAKQRSRLYTRIVSELKSLIEQYK
ncbi:MAG: hypothetical protein H6953_01135 [Chromatiaceae bacterium]|nr:hypothetical protein [Gammaproteobacteria bacterium]MCP5304023.1 hypothetical protein [Chromatiaceae bacterium]MCP5313749.1 hypothetical protein [Chromatiaceae bacterium]